MKPPDKRFVNPYAFVPLPKAVVRRAWLGHRASAAQDRYSGTITATWTLKAPLLLPQNADLEGWIRPDGAVQIPGSALKGAVRSLHEALFNGCFRVIDKDFTPAYRDPAEGFVDLQNWRLAIVTADSAGVPTEFQLSQPGSIEWVEARSLKERWPGKDLPSSGDVARILGPRVDGTIGRVEVRSVSKVEVLAEAGQAAASVGAFPLGRVFLVTDTAARKVYRRDGSLANCFWASGELSGDIVAFDPRGSDAAAWADFNAACKGSNDRRLLEQQRKLPGGSGHLEQAWRRQRRYADVSWPPQRPGAGGSPNPCGRRVMQSGFLFRGDVVWVRFVGAGITQIRFAQIWRSPAKNFRVADRIGDAGACPHAASPKELCLSCVTFGAAETDGKRGEGKQTSYAGHVRFSSGISPVGTRTRQVSLAPMGSPNPGSAPFYLRMDPVVSVSLKQDDIPSHWDVAEQGRQINGRKFYWHSDPDAQATYWSERNRSPVSPRYQDLERGRPSKMTRKATLVAAGTTFTASIGVDQLDQVGVDALLASLDPKRVLHLTQHHQSGLAEYAVHLGGGKPFGLGSATVQLEVQLTLSRDRYGRAKPVLCDWPDLGAEPGRSRLRAILDRVGTFGSNLEALAILLDLNGLGELKHQVSYPPGAAWSEVGSKQFRQSFEFFQQTNGQQLAHSRREWLVLPRVLPGSDPSLPIRTKRGPR